MFRVCSELSSFTSELPRLTNGEEMFDRCSNLSSFSSKLPRLTNGQSMFNGCKLDKPSVMNILSSIPALRRRAAISIGTGYDYTKDKDTLQAIEEAKDKGWNVRIEFNR